MKQVTTEITILWEQGDHDWERFPKAAYIDGVEVNMQTLREFVIRFQPTKQTPNEERIHPFKDPARLEVPQYYNPDENRSRLRRIELANRKSIG